MSVRFASVSVRAAALLAPSCVIRENGHHDHEIRVDGFTHELLRELPCRVGLLFGLLKAAGP
jgi:hypothetical protein